VYSPAYLVATRAGLHRVVTASHRAATQVKARWKLCNEARLFAEVNGPDGSHTQGAQFAEVKVCAYARSAAEGLRAFEVMHKRTRRLAEERMHKTEARRSKERGSTRGRKRPRPTSTLSQMSKVHKGTTTRAREYSRTHARAHTRVPTGRFGMV
jgi:hypothetical protein